MLQEITHAVPTKRSPHPITAPWAISEAAKLGGDFLRWLMVDAGVVRRQATFAVASRGWLTNPEGIVAQLQPDRLHESAAALADLLRHGPLREIIGAAYGSNPLGLIESFNRLGADAFSDSARYQTFFEMFSDRAHRPKLKVARYMGRLTETKLDVLFRIDPALLHVTMLNRDMTVEEVENLNTALAAIRTASTPEDEAALIAAAVAGGEHRTIEKFVSAWIRRCRLGALPFEADPAAGVFPITTAAALMAASVRFKNCARSLHRVVDAIAGRSGYVAHEIDGKAVAMTALVRFENGALAIENVYGPSNDRVDPEIQAPIRKWFADRGVMTMRRQRLEPAWATTLSLVGVRHWGHLDDPDLLED